MSHRYTYVLNNPIMFIDPWGLCVQKDIHRSDTYFPGDMYGSYEKLHGYDIQHHPSVENISPKMREFLKRVGEFGAELLYQRYAPGLNPSIINPPGGIDQLNPFSPSPAEAFEPRHP